MKTTPKPSATKNNKGELVGPLDCEFEVCDMVADDDVDDGDCDIAGVGPGVLLVLCVPPSARS